MSSVNWPSCWEMPSSLVSRALILSAACCGRAEGSDWMASKGRSSVACCNPGDIRMPGAGYSHGSASLLQLRHGRPPLHRDFLLLHKGRWSARHLSGGSVIEQLSYLPASVASLADAPDRPVAVVLLRAEGGAVCEARAGATRSASGPFVRHV